MQTSITNFYVGRANRSSPIWISAVIESSSQSCSISMSERYTTSSARDTLLRVVRFACARVTIESFRLLEAKAWQRKSVWIYSLERDSWLHKSICWYLQRKNASVFILTICCDVRKKKLFIYILIFLINEAWEKWCTVFIALIDLGFSKVNCAWASI